LYKGKTSWGGLNGPKFSQFKRILEPIVDTLVVDVVRIDMCPIDFVWSLLSKYINILYVIMVDYSHAENSREETIFCQEFPDEAKMELVKRFHPTFFGPDDTGKHSEAVIQWRGQGRRPHSARGSHVHVLVADQHVPQGSNHASKGGSQTD